MNCITTDLSTIGHWFELFWHPLVCNTPRTNKKNLYLQHTQLKTQLTYLLKVPLKLMYRGYLHCIFYLHGNEIQTFKRFLAHNLLHQTRILLSWIQPKTRDELRCSWKVSNLWFLRAILCLFFSTYDCSLNFSSRKLYLVIVNFNIVHTKYYFYEMYFFFKFKQTGNLSIYVRNIYLLCRYLKTCN